MNNPRQEISALISLLDDPDSLVQQPVINRLIEMGSPAIKVLEHTWERSPNSLVQERIEHIILSIQQSNIRKDMKDWVDCHGDNLIYGAGVLARSQYPDLDLKDIESEIEKYRSEIWLELNDRLTALEKIRVINHFLFKVHGFNRSLKGTQSPQLYLVNHVLDTHKGLPVTLAIIYAEIAMRLDLPVYCVDLPRNFLLCYHDPNYFEDPDGILFYINPYARGAVLGRPEVELFLQDQKIEKKPEYMRPCSNVEAVKRLTEGLRYAYGASRMTDKVDFLDELLVILNSKPGNYSL